MLLIGPCMFFAPLLVVLVPVAIILWPPTLILVGLAWLVTRPFAGDDGASQSGVGRVHATLTGWFLTLLTPWTFFDTPKGPPATGPDRDARPPE